MKLTNLTTVLVLSCAACATAVGQTGDDAGPGAIADAAPKDAAPKKSPLESGAPPTDDAGQPTTDAGAPPLDDSTCAGLTTKGQCEQCCLKVHPSGYGVYSAQLDDCACNSPGACASECATETCANAPTKSGDACEQCISGSLVQGTGACYDGVAAACQADTDCTTLFGTCIPPCESK